MRSQKQASGDPIRHHGLLGDAVIVSDDAGQFRVGNHALCWVHAERLLQKLMPATPRQVHLVETVRDLVWRFKLNFGVRFGPRAFIQQTEGRSK